MRTPRSGGRGPRPRAARARARCSPPVANSTTCILPPHLRFGQIETSMRKARFRRLAHGCRDGVAGRSGGRPVAGSDAASGSRACTGVGILGERLLPGRPAFRKPIASPSRTPTRPPHLRPVLAKGAPDGWPCRSPGVLQVRARRPVARRPAPRRRARSEAAARWGVAAPGPPGT